MVIDSSRFDSNLSKIQAKRVSSVKGYRRFSPGVYRPARLLTICFLPDQMEDQNSYPQHHEYQRPPFANNLGKGPLDDPEAERKKEK